jgi:exopolysaccharide production protein ExoZ
MTGRLQSIDMVRGLAACAIVLWHANPHFNFGGVGVDFFFIVSGFVMVGAAEGRTASEFLIARVWRVFPIYWIALLPWLFWATMSGPLNGGAMIREFMLWPLWFNTAVPWFFLAWTLTFEILFYAAAAVTIRRQSAVLPIFIFMLAFGAWGTGLSDRLMWVGNPIILEFLLGVLIARLPRDETAGLRCVGVGVTWLMVSLGTTYSVRFEEFWPSLTRVLLWGIPAGLIVYGLITIEERFTCLLVRALSFLGGASYSIYLFHLLIVDHMTAQWPIKLIAGVALGIVAWAVFERPILRVRPAASWRRLRGPRPSLSHESDAASC